MMLIRTGSVFGRLGARSVQEADVLLSGLRFHAQAIFTTFREAFALTCGYDYRLCRGNPRGALRAIYHELVIWSEE